MATRATARRAPGVSPKRRDLPPRGELLLLQAAAHVSPDRAFEAWTTLVRDAGGAEDVIRWASDGAGRRLLPLLGARRHMLELPLIVAEACRDATVEAWGLNERLFVLCAEPLAALAERMPVVALKGAALLGDVFPRHRIRPVGDIDILVPHARAREALRVLAAAGWQDTDPGRPFRFTLLPSINLAGPVTGSIDLHWRSAWTLSAHPRLHRAPAPGTVEPLPDASPLAGLGLVRATPGRLLVQLAVNGMKPGGTSLHWMADVAALLTHHGLAAADIVGAAAAHDAHLVTHAALSQVRDVLGVGRDLRLEDLAPSPSRARRQLRRITATDTAHELDELPGVITGVRTLRGHIVRLARPGRPLHALRIGVTVVLASLMNRLGRRG